MLEQVFHKLLYMSFSAMWLAVAVVALRVLLRKAPRRVVMLLWAMLAVRLIFPVSVESPISLVPRPETVAQTVQRPAEPAAAEPQSEPAVVFHPERLWLVGTGAMLLWGLWGDLRLRRRVRVSIPEGQHVRLCDEIDTPFVLGILRPEIYLPSGLDETQAVYVLAHERAHIARRDHWWKPLGWVLLSVYWFHPLIWLSYILFCRDLELACDERVASSLDREGLAAYSEALLQCSTRRGALASPVAFGETGVKVRVRAILRYRKPALRVVLTALLCVVVVGALFLTERPAAAMQLAETVLPEIQPLQEDDWTLPVRGRTELPEPSAEPETAASAAPAQTSAPTQTAAVQSPSIRTPDQQALEEFIQAREQTSRTATPEPRTLSDDQAPTYTAPTVPASTGSTEPNPAAELSPVQYADAQVIQLFP